MISLPDLSPLLPDGVIDIDDTEDGMCEYEAEMAAYLREREEMFVVSASFLEQGSVTAEHRAVLVDWLLQVIGVVFPMDGSADLFFMRSTCRFAILLAV